MKNIYLILAFLFISVSLIFSQPTPVAYYPFNGDANDAGSNGVNGTLFGNPTLTTNNSGVANTAYSFDGVDDYISLGSSMVLKPDSQVSLALWAHSTNWASFSSWAALAGNTASGGYELIIHGSSGTLESQCKRNGTYGITSYALTNLSSGWHHLAFTFDGRYSILYVDAISVDTDDAGALYSIQYGNPGNSTIIGDEAGTGATPEGDSFIGKIDEVRFYDVALTAQEILTLYNSSLNINNMDVNTFLGTAYPNPASDMVNLVVPQQNNVCAVTISDFTGKSIFKTEVKPQNGMILLERPVFVKAGFYMLTIEGNAGVMSTHKVVFR